MTKRLEQKQVDFRIEDDLIKKSRKEHICTLESCKKVIPKGTSYFRRSFGRVWTWKACSEKCALKLHRTCGMWVL